MIKEIPNGVFPTMLTPFTDGNKIDYNGVEQILNWYSKKKTDGIFAICQSSEIFYLSFEERYELLKFITAHAPKGMSMVASGNTATTLTGKYMRRINLLNSALTHTFLYQTALRVKTKTTAYF